MERRIEIGSIHMSRVEAHIIETSDKEPSNMDLLYIVARCLRSPIVDSTHRDRMSVEVRRVVTPERGREASGSRVEARRKRVLSSARSLCE